MVNIAILNFGSKCHVEVSDLIAKAGGYPIWCAYNTTLKRLKEMKVDGVVITGSYDTVYDGGKQCLPEIIDGTLPVFGICYGQQLINYLTGGTVEKSPNPEHGVYEIVATDGRIFKGIKGAQNVKMHHNDYVTKLGNGFIGTSHSENTPYASCENVERKLYGVQFHPESDGNTYGVEIMKNFLEICEEG